MPTLYPQIIIITLFFSTLVTGVVSNRKDCLVTIIAICDVNKGSCSVMGN